MSWGQGDVITVCWGRERLLTRRHIPSLGRCCRVSVWQSKVWGFLKWEEEASSQCYRPFLKRRTDLALESLEWIKWSSSQKKMHTLISFMTGDLSRESAISLANQDVPSELNLKYTAGKKLNLFLQSHYWADLFLSSVIFRCPSKAFQCVHWPGTSESVWFNDKKRAKSSYTSSASFQRYRCFWGNKLFHNDAG